MQRPRGRKELSIFENQRERWLKQRKQSQRKINKVGGSTQDQPRISNIQLIRDQERQSKQHQCKTSRMMPKDVLEKEKRDRKEHYQRNNTRKCPRVEGHEPID